jgi:mRNA-decapping enzyme subunit 2
MLINRSPSTDASLPGFDDLSVRFLLNLPKSELESIPRLCFQVEEAQWYYEDFVRPLAATIGRPLPSMHLRQFCLQLFQHCPLLSGFTSEQHLAAYEEFLAYKVRVPVRGAILLDESMERVVLVKGWKKGASWSFPRGKINKDEKDLDCTIREVWEETGFDIRAAGLVPDNDRDVKYIDITMREQHMRMFVFRDVPLDTYFEPKTRKEISKIQWYNLRDLPGFVRRNRNEGDNGNTNKFYMVAPFMSHIKKWIGQQKRKDEAVAQTEEQLVAHGLDAEHVIDEEPELYAPPVNAAPTTVDRSEELKRLLSIGGLGNAPVQQVPQPPQMSQANHLLAMLQGGPRVQQSAGPPHTPMDQINAFITQPESPHPRHPRQQPMAHQQPPPQFPLSPQRMAQHEQQSNTQFPPPAFGQSHNGPFGPNGQQVQMAQPSFQQQQQYQHNAPGTQPGQMFSQSNGHANHLQAQQQPLQIPQHMLPQRQTPVSGQYQIQGQHGAIASGPSAPNASQLPPPRISAQSMKLLDAFKTGQKPAQPSSSYGAAPRSGSVHQSALLGLFKSSPAPAPAQIQQDPRSEHAIVSPAPDEFVERPAALQERRPTLNEITRSLPVNFKAKRPSQHSPAIPTQLPAVAPPAPVAAQVPEPVSVQRLEPEAKQQHAPIPKPQSPANVPKTRSSNGPKEPKSRDAPASSAKQIMQRTGARQTPGNTPRDKSASSPSPARQPKAKSKVTEPQAPMTILARPGSSRDKSGSPANAASKQAYQPQLLKRHEANDSNSEPANGPSDAHDRASNSDGNGKRDHLLALFSKAPAATQAPAQDLPAAAISPAPAAVVSPTVQAPAPASVGVAAPAPAKTHNNNLLNLFDKTAPAQQSSPQPSPAPPSAPALQPTQHPAKPRTPAPPPIISHPPQNALLDLFKKPSHGHAASPSTDSPISPFNLGSPHAMRHGPGPMSEQPKSRLGSVASAGSRRGSGNAASGKGSGGATPTEQKDFLLGFLNGVVQKEGQRKG